jgi:hypothetical protein
MAGCAGSSTSCHRLDCLYGSMKEINETAFTSILKDEHSDLRNMSKSLKVN